jgi:hypothetical protein
VDLTPPSDLFEVESRKNNLSPRIAEFQHCNFSTDHVKDGGESPPAINEYDSGSCKFTTPAYNMDLEHLRVIRKQNNSFLSF